jgi:hypothetical protein
MNHIFTCILTVKSCKELYNFVKDISPKSYIFWQICKIFRQNCISFANVVIKIKHISTEFVNDLLLKCAEM